MNKIIRAINSIIANQDIIINVASDGEDEYFFEYKGYIWSICQFVNDYLLYYYPNTKSVKELTNLEEPREYHDFVEYSAEDYKTREAVESFSNLYLMIKEKLYNVDKVLDDIIEEDF